MWPENSLHHFCFGRQSAFDFYMYILSSGTNEMFLPNRLKKCYQDGQPSD